MGGGATASDAPPGEALCRICWSAVCEYDGRPEFLSPTPCACRDERSNVHQACLECVPPRLELARETKSRRLPRPGRLAPSARPSAASAPRRLADNVPPPPTYPPPPLRRWILEARSQGRFDAGTRCHACGDPYAHPLLDETVLSASARSAIRASSLSPLNGAADDRTPLAIIGGTGYVGRSVALHLLGHPTFKIGAVVGSVATVGKPFRAVFEKKEDALVEHYGADLWKPQEFPAELMHCVVQSVEDVIADGVIKTALSFIAPEHGEIEDALARAGIKVFRRVLHTGSHTTPSAW
jgi:hypothetical protein